MHKLKNRQTHELKAHHNIHVYAKIYTPQYIARRTDYHIESGCDLPPGPAVFGTLLPHVVRRSPHSYRILLWHDPAKV